MLKTVSTANGLVSPTFSGNVTLSNGNLVQGTAGKGVNFTANTPTAGMTTQLLNNYEEGTWTPVPSKSSAGAITGSIVSYGKYIRVGNLVTLFCDVSINSISAQGSGLTSISGIPFTAARSYIGVGALGYNSAFLTVVMASCYAHSNGNIYFHESLNTDSNSTADWKAVGYLSLTVSYYV